MIEDCRGLPTSAGNAEAVALADRALQRFLEYRTDTAACIQAAHDADPDWLMPPLLLAGALHLMGTHAVASKRDTWLAKVRDIAVRRGDSLHRRERLHADALERWVAGDLEGACRQWEAIVIDWPRDLLALRSLHFQNFWMGRASYMRNAIGAALLAWDETVPGYGFALGMAAFGFEECGEYGRAEVMAREAVERNCDDLWSVHAVAHVLEMQGRMQEGSAWLDGADDQWSDRGPFKGHLWWHAALFAVEQKAFDKALDLYDRHVRPGEIFVSTDMMNAPSLLARLEFQGVNVGDRWQSLAERSVAWIDDHVVPFTDAHTMFPLARAGRPEAERFIQAMETLAASGSGYLADVTAPYLLPIARAVRAYYAGRYDETVELLQPLRAQLQPIGGSHAQRDLFHQLLTEAAIKGRHWTLARSLVGERLALRPDNPINRDMLAIVQREAS